MKTLAVLIFLAMFVVSCGGGMDDPSTTNTRTGAKGNTPVFEPPPTPGSN